LSCGHEYPRLVCELYFGGLTNDKNFSATLKILVVIPRAGQDLYVQVLKKESRNASLVFFI